MDASVGPADEFLDKQRRELMEQLADVIGKSRMTSAAWVCLWFANIEMLQSLIPRVIEDEAFRRVFKSMLRSPDISDMLRDWCARPKKKPKDAGSQSDLEDNQISDQDSNDETPSGKRKARTMGKQSPSKIPKLINRPSPQKAAASSVRPSMTSTKTSTARKKSARNLSKTEQEEFWEILPIFWTSEKTDSWKAEILGPQGTEHCANLMCFSNIAHKLWEKARFALCPRQLSDDLTTLTVKFFWLPTMDYLKSQSITRAPSPIAPDLISSPKDGIPFAKLFKLATEEKIPSGDILTFHTTDPVKLPLPSVKLLQLQWTLHRVLAMSGAADASDEDLDPDFHRLAGAAGVGETKSKKRTVKKKKKKSDAKAVG
ncbi:hypothetical protein ARAM_005780 [Aspergillus rambellii]|uniref:Uncharacterized protein n=1 Tax=Aspergillus rambellii TaxID=308745 RepID=A0A0F8UDQ3_9EURO|nr:hypothetical protein ARAM_005780 [Aspergillus rambellii]